MKEIELFYGNSFSGVSSKTFLSIPDVSAGLMLLDCGFQNLKPIEDVIICLLFLFVSLFCRIARVVTF